MSVTNLHGAPPLPFAPLEPWLDRIHANPKVSSNLRDAVKSARRRGLISVITADRIAVALGLHPGLIWSEDWWLPAEGVAS